MLLFAHTSWFLETLHDSEVVQKFLKREARNVWYYFHLDKLTNQYKHCDFS